MHGMATLTSLVLPMYLPAFLLAIGDGAMNTFLPLYLMRLGTGVAGAALLVGVGAAGVLVFDLPSGFIVARYGERRVLTVSGAVMVASSLLIALSPSPAVATLGVFLASGAAAFWLVGRLEFMRKALASGSRGRGLSTVGGVMRAGLFLGPVIGGLVAASAGYRVVFVGTACLAAVALALFVASPAAQTDPPVARTAAPRLWDPGALKRVLRSRARVLATAGLSMAILSLARAGRTLVFPLWGQSIGLGDAGIGLVVGVSSAADTLMFLPAGLVSDRRGRKWSAVSCLFVLSLGMAMIPLARSLGAFIAVGLLVGLGNGMGSGINMTLGADFAADSEPGVFLGVWRLVTDVGAGVSPFLVSLVTTALALGPASLVIAALGLAGGAFHAAVVPETRWGIGARRSVRLKPSGP